MLIAVLVVFATSTFVSAEYEATNDMMAGMSVPMQKSMDPQVWMQMMTMMMDPAKAMSMESCALCHEGDDLARYTKDFGPMMEASQQMGQFMSPHQWMQMTNPMMSTMMNPMAMMGPMMNPMMGMMGPMMNPMGMMGPMMNPMGMMGPMMNPMGMMGGGTGYNAANPMGSMMDPKQYESWFNQMTEMMNSFAPKTDSQ